MTVQDYTCTLDRVLFYLRLQIRLQLNAVGHVNHKNICFYRCWLNARVRLLLRPLQTAVTTFTAMSNGTIYLPTFKFHLFGNFPCRRSSDS